MYIRISLTCVLEHGRITTETGGQEIVVPVSKESEQEILGAIRDLNQGLPNESLEISMVLHDSTGQVIMSGKTPLKVS